MVFGSGGLAREVHEVVEDINNEQRRWNCLGFLDDDPRKWGTEVHGLPVLGGLAWLDRYPSIDVVIAVGSPAVRRRIALAVKGRGHPLATLVHPIAWVGRRVDIGVGSVIRAGAVLSTDIRVGCCVFVGAGATVSHDTEIGDFVTIAPGVNIPGAVTINEGCDIGIGATMLQGITLGEWSIVGAGAVVIESLPPNVTAVGVPARVIKQRPEGWHEKV